MAEENIFSILDEMEGRQKALEQQNQDLAEGLQASLFDSKDLATSSSEYFLESERLKAQIERQLRGDIPKHDKGNVYYIKQPNAKLVKLNDLGVSSIMYVISMYIDKNTFRANLKEDRIYEILYYLGLDLNDVLYINLEAFGLDSPEKKAGYSTIIITVLDAIEFALSKAIDGKEAELTSSKNLNLNQGYGNTSRQTLSPQITKKFNILDPSTY